MATTPIGNASQSKMQPSTYTYLKKAYKEYLHYDGIVSNNSTTNDLDLYIERVRTYLGQEHYQFQKAVKMADGIKDLKGKDADKATDDLLKYINSLKIHGSYKLAEVCINRIINFIETYNELNEDKCINIGYVYGRFCVFDGIRCRAIDETDFVNSFVAEIVLKSLGIKHGDVTLKTFKEQVLNSINSSFNRTIGEERRNQTRYLTFNDCSLEMTRHGYTKAKHDIDHHQFHYIDTDYNSIHKLEDKDLDDIHELIKQDCPTWAYYIDSSFKSYIDFVNVCEFVVQAFVECPDNRKCFVINGERDSGKSVLADVLDIGFGDYTTTKFRVQKACDNDSKTAGQELNRGGEALLRIDDDKSIKKADSDNFKMLVNGKNIAAEIKFKNAWNFDLEIRMLVLSNYDFEIKDKGGHIDKRLYTIDMLYDGEIDTDLTDNLLKEWDKMVKYIVAIGLKSLKRKGKTFTYNPEADSRIEALTDNVYTTFVKNAGAKYLPKEEVNETNYITSDDLLRLFKAHCIKQGVKYVPSLKAIYAGLAAAIKDRPKGTSLSHRMRVGNKTPRVALIEVTDTDYYNSLFDDAQHDLVRKERLSDTGTSDGTQHDVFGKGLSDDDKDPFSHE